MNNGMKVRKTIDMDIEFEAIIQKMANEKQWSFSQMSLVLLQSAVHEKLRKKHPKKDDNLQDNSPNPRSSNAG